MHEQWWLLHLPVTREDELSAIVDLLGGLLGPGVARERLVDLAREHAVEERFDTGDVVIRQGEPGDRIFVALSGRLQASRSEGGDEVVLGEIHHGETFGEIGILASAPRMATVRALTPATTLSLAADVVAGAVSDASRAELEALAEARLQWARTRRFRPDTTAIFAALEPFTGRLDSDARDTLVDEVQWQSAPRGTELIREGTVADCLYLLLSGRLEVLQRQPDGTERSVAEIGPGEPVGEAALLTNEPRSATVRVLRDAAYLRLSRSGFEGLVSAHPQAMIGFARTMATRLQRSLRSRDPATRPGPESLVSVEEIEAIVDTSNLVLRNLKITHTYYRLSLDLARLMGQRDANWCTFATAASKTAGYSIRGEDVPFRAAWRWAGRRRVLGPALRVAARGTRLEHRAQHVLDAVSDHISTGNLKVFAELAPLFARFVLAFDTATTHDLDRLRAFLDARVRRGVTEAGGQDLLAEALTHYHDAMFERSEKARAEVMLLGNLKVGLHEQIRLQPEIEAALNAAADVGFEGLFPVPGGARIEHRAAQALRRPIRLAATRLMMRLRLPGGDVRLGRDVPGVRSASPFPDVLRALTLPELIDLVERLDDDTETTYGSQATDWADLGQRMNYITDLFRTRQRSLQMFEAPFEYDQRLDMVSDVLPAGEL